MLSILHHAVNDIETRQSVAHIVRDLVEDVAAWDMEVALYGAQLATEEKSYEIRVLHAKLKQVETRNTFLEDHLRKLKEAASSVRSVLIEDLSSVLASSRETTALRRKVDWYKERFESIQMPDNYTRTGAASIKGFNKDGKDDSVGAHATPVQAVAEARDHDGVIDDEQKSQGVGKRRLTLLDLEDKAVLTVFSFLEASEVLGVAQTCRATFKRVDEIFGIGSAIIKSDWPMSITTVEDKATAELNIEDASATMVPLSPSLSRTPSFTGLSRAVAATMTEKLSEAEMSAIIKMMDELRSRGSALTKLQEREVELSAELSNAIQEQDKLHVELDTMSRAQATAVAEVAALRKQKASDAEVITFMDTRGLDLESENAELKHRCERLEAGLDLQRGTHEHVEQRLRADLAESRARIDELESTHRAQKRVLVKEVKSLRATSASASRELGLYKSQLHAVREALDERYS
jgi:hypothetical protein